MSNISPRVIFLLLVGTLHVLQSCCKADCANDDVSSIHFYGFDSSDMEKIKLTRFHPFNPGSAIDSYYVSTNNIIIGDTSRVYLDTSMFNNFRYKITLERTGINYIVSDFVTTTESCKCGPENYKKIISFKLNGVRMLKHDWYMLEIRK